MAGTRRGLLKKTLGGAALLIAAGAVPLALRKTRLRTPPRKLLFFTPAEYSIWAAVADWVLAPDATAATDEHDDSARAALEAAHRPGAPTPAAVDVAGKADAFLAPLPPSDAKDSQAAPRPLRQRALQLRRGRPAAAVHADGRRRSGRALEELADLAARHQADRLPGDEAPLLRPLLLRSEDVRVGRLSGPAGRAGPLGPRVAQMIDKGSDKDLVLKPDVCVVGSGPGGAMVASRLAQAGAKVVVLEEGGYHQKDEFDMQEATAFPRLYQDRGNRASADLSISGPAGPGGRRRHRRQLDHQLPHARRRARALAGAVRARRADAGGAPAALRGGRAAPRHREGGPRGHEPQQPRPSTTDARSSAGRWTRRSATSAAACAPGTAGWAARSTPSRARR